MARHDRRWIVEVMGDGTHTARGLCEFVSLPVMGDRLSLAKPEGTFDIMGVVLVEHVPAPSPPPGGSAPAPEPSATVCSAAVIAAVFLAENPGVTGAYRSAAIFPR